MLKDQPILIYVLLFVKFKYNNYTIIDIELIFKHNFFETYL